MWCSLRLLIGIQLTSGQAQSIQDTFIHVSGTLAGIQGWLEGWTQLEQLSRGPTRGLSNMEV